MLPDQVLCCDVTLFLVTQPVVDQLQQISSEVEKEERDREDDDDDSDGDDSDDSVGDDRVTSLFLQAVRQDRDVSVSESVGRVAGDDRAVGRVDQDGVETAVAVPGVASQVQHLELVPGEK